MLYKRYREVLNSQYIKEIMYFNKQFQEFGWKSTLILTLMLLSDICVSQNR